jgi:hypothetical protein
VCEIDYETIKAKQRGNQPGHFVTKADLLAMDQRTSRVTADYLTIRRLAELTGVRTLEQLHSLNMVLAEYRTAHYEPPLYRCHIG